MPTNYSRRTIVENKNWELVPSEPREWLSSFKAGCTELLTPFMLERIEMVGVSIKGCCGCEHSFDIDELGGFSWMHENHAIYNRIVWEALNEVGLIGPLREMLVEDLGVTNSRLGPEWGNCLKKDYGQLVLDNFLRPDPNPEWVGAD